MLALSKGSIAGEILKMTPKISCPNMDTVSMIKYRARECVVLHDKTLQV